MEISLSREIPGMEFIFSCTNWLNSFLGFELPLVACCGYGGKYNYSNSAECGATVKVNGSQIFVGSCKRPSARVIWDGIHYTEAAAKLVFDKISAGEFSDPPLPFKQACHRIILD